MSQSGGEGSGDRRRSFSLGADFPIRTAAAVIMAGGALGLAWVGGFPFLVFWLAAGVGVVWEWQRLIGGRRLWARTAIGAAALIIASPFALHESVAYAAGIIVVGAVASGDVADAGRRFEVGAGVIYAGAMVVGINVLRASPEYGFAATLWVFAVVWGTDVAAYVGGRLIGGPKLWARVSPGKTWSGAIVGALASAVLGVGFAAAAPGPLKILAMAALGLAVSVFSQAGDLFESALKRRAGVKDSSHLIPGHGGLMDRLDGFVVGVALATTIAFARHSGAGIASGLFLW